MHCWHLPRLCVFIQNQRFSQQAAYTINALYEGSRRAEATLGALSTGMVNTTAVLGKVRGRTHSLQHVHGYVCIASMGM